MSQQIAHVMPVRNAAQLAGHIAEVVASGNFNAYYEALVNLITLTLADAFKNDGQRRADYQQQIKAALKAVAQIHAHLCSKPDYRAAVAHHFAASAVKMRNDIMADIRNKTSPVGHLIAWLWKQSPKTLEDICAHYASTPRPHNYEDQIDIYHKVVAAAGRPNAVFNNLGTVQYALSGLLWDYAHWAPRGIANLQIGDAAVLTFLNFVKTVMPSPLFLDDHRCAPMLALFLGTVMCLLI